MVMNNTLRWSFRFRFHVTSLALWGNRCGIRILASKVRPDGCVQCVSRICLQLCRCLKDMLERVWHTFESTIYIYRSIGFLDVWCMENCGIPANPIPNSGPCSSQMHGSYRHASPCRSALQSIQNSPEFNWTLYRSQKQEHIVHMAMGQNPGT